MDTKIIKIKLLTSVIQCDELCRVNTKQPSKKKRAGDRFIRKTVTLPREVGDFANQRAAELMHAGNVSSYIRTLILKDLDRKKAA